MTTTRPCPQCGQAVQGRADKRFCSAACRAHHFRDQQLPLAEYDDQLDDALDDASEGPTRPFDDLVGRLPVPPPVGEATADAEQAPSLQTLINEALDRHAHTQAVQAAHQARQAMHARYEAWVQTWLSWEEPPLQARDVKRYLQQTEALSAQCRAHPAITQSDHPAQQRLQLLYKISDDLSDLQRALAEQAASFSLWKHAAPTDTFTFTKKRRQQLRASLLGEH